MTQVMQPTKPRPKNTCPNTHSRKYCTQQHLLDMNRCKTASCLQGTPAKVMAAEGKEAAEEKAVREAARQTHMALPQWSRKLAIPCPCSATPLQFACCGIGAHRQETPRPPTAARTLCASKERLSKYIRCRQPSHCSCTWLLLDDDKNSLWDQHLHDMDMCGSPSRIEDYRFHPSMHCR